MVSFKWDGESIANLESQLLKEFDISNNDQKNLKQVKGIIAELKQKFPDGYVSKENKICDLDSLINSAYIAFLKKRSDNSFIGWSGDDEKLLKSTYIKMLASQKNIDDKKKNGFASCVIQKLKNKYPDGISFFVSKKSYYNVLLKNISESCAKEFDLFPLN